MRRKKASPEALQRMREADSKIEWTATCRLCKAELRGLIKELKEHKCA